MRLENMKRGLLTKVWHSLRVEYGLLLFFIFPVLTFAQAIQPCVVKQYNQKEEKTPLSGVQVEVRGAGTEVSDAQGALTLSFTTLKPGDRVVKRDIKKDGYEVFNTSAVEQWTISRDRTPFQIVLVRSDYMRQLEQTLRQNSLQNYKLKYEQTKRDLAAEKAAGKIKEEEYRQQMEKLEDQYDNALKDLDNYIDQFAHFDLNEVSAEEQRILDMVQQGQIDEAVKAYENLQLSEKLLQERADLKKLDEVSARVEEEKVRKKENVTRLWEALDREITTLMLAGGPENFEKIGRILKEQALADTTAYGAVMRYSDFAFEQADYQEAERFYGLCLKMELKDSTKYFLYNQIGGLYLSMNDYARSEQYLLSALEGYQILYAHDPELWRLDLAISMMNVGLLYGSLNNYSESLSYLVAALEHFKILFAQKPDLYRQNIADVQMNLGGLYYFLKDDFKSEQYLLAALDNYKILFSQNPDAYRPYLGKNQMNLGGLYFFRKDYPKSEQYLLAALDNYKILFSQNPNAYRPNLASTLGNLGGLCLKYSDYVQSEQHLLAALEHCLVLFELNPDTWRSELAKTQMNLGLLYFMIQEFRQSEHYLQDAVKQYNILFNQNQDAWRPDLAMAQMNLAGVCSSLKDYQQSEQLLLAALEHYKLLFAGDPDVWRPDLSSVQDNLGVLYGIMKDYTRSEEYIHNALEHRYVLFAHNPDVWRPELANTLIELGNLYKDKRDYTLSEQYYSLAAEHYKSLYAQDFNAWCPGLAMVENDLGMLYYTTRNYSKSEKCFLASLELYQILYVQNPDAWRSDVASVQRNLGDLYKFLDDNSQSEHYYKAALKNYLFLLQKDTVTYCAVVTNLDCFIGRLYYKNAINDTAEQFYKMALEHISLLFNYDSIGCREGRIIVNQELAQIYRTNKNMNGALSHYFSALRDQYCLLATDSALYCEKVNDLELTVCDLLNSLQKYDLLEKYYRNAADHCEWLYKKNPTFYDSRLSIIYLELTEAYVRNKKYVQAVACVDRMITLYPNEPKYYDRKGEILLMSRDEKGALVMWRKVIELDPDFLKHLEEIGNTSELYKGLKDKGLVE